MKSGLGKLAKISKEMLVQAKKLNAAFSASPDLEKVSGGMEKLGGELERLAGEGDVLQKECARALKTLVESDLGVLGVRGKSCVHNLALHAARAEERDGGFDPMARELKEFLEDILGTVEELTKAKAALEKLNSRSEEMGAGFHRCKTHLEQVSCIVEKSAGRVKLIDGEAQELSRCSVAAAKEFLVLGRKK